jgi:hypothetical protein
MCVVGNNEKEKPSNLPSCFPCGFEMGSIVAGATGITYHRAFYITCKHR